MSNLESRLSAPRIVRHSDELLQVIRARIAELGTTHNSIEETRGLQLGYLTKVISDPPPKRVGLFVAFLILQTLGCSFTFPLRRTLRSEWHIALSGVDFLESTYKESK